jgi:hypothetical protein
MYSPKMGNLIINKLQNQNKNSKAMLKTRVIKVYQKPLTNEDFEGQAALIKKENNVTSNQPGYEYWYVRFLDEENKVLRLVNVSC